MLFVISGRATPDVSSESGKLSKRLEAEIMQRMTPDELTSHLKAIVLFPTILNPEIASLPDSVTHKRSEGAMFVALGISHAEWIDASAAGQLDLIARNVRASLEKIP